MDYGRPSLADALAAEYVAGSLRGPARRRFEALLPGHPALQAAVRHWQARLMPLTAVLPPEPPPPELWRRIEARLWPQPAASSALATEGLPWWRRLGVWRGLSAFATVAAVGFAVLLASPAPVLPPVVIVLQGTGEGQAATSSFVASVSGDGRALVTRPLVQVSLESDRVLELWSVPPEGNPRSLGLISANGLTVLPRDRLPATLLRGGTAALAVSVEPPGGSPTGVPTGPVVFAGKMVL
jgi:anti-sigma-K factor RskA